MIDTFRSVWGFGKAWILGDQMGFVLSVEINRAREKTSVPKYSTQMFERYCE
jgi:hypothetical protein